MALKDHVTPRHIVPLLGDNGVAVRGLNLDDFSFLLGEHLEAASKIADLYSKHKNSIFSQKPFQDFILSIAKDFPGLVSEVISVAADEPDTKDIRLGIGLQISVLNAIIKLTMEEAGGLGNLIAQLRAVGAGVLAQNLADAGDKLAPFNTSTGPGANR
jgi:hypothetical protein